MLKITGELNLLGLLYPVYDCHDFGVNFGIRVVLPACNLTHFILVLVV